ncbi:MAG: hypothetical protein IT559_02535 [Alphaproteobacteria bacterium]|nr:hypothetical protein [Alphaproteobacteria bacterium]
MKIWNGYGSEHSMNLVMVGQFKSIESAEKAKELIDNLKDGLSDIIDVDIENPYTRYPEEAKELLRALNFVELRPSELEQFLYDNSVEIEGDKIIFKTEESDVSAFLKILVHKGAKVQVYTAHEYPYEEYGRGK